MSDSYCGDGRVDNVDNVDLVGALIELSGLDGQGADQEEDGHG